METKQNTGMIRFLNPLRWYTGYYSLVATKGTALPQGAYLQIVSSGNQDSLFDISYFVISMDGKTSQKYEHGFTVDNPNNTIIIDHVGSFSLVKSSSERAVSSLHGNINNIEVKGFNYFSPVPLEIFCGNYFNVLNKETTLSIQKSQEGHLMDIKFDFGHGLQTVENYTYDPTMYLLAFENNKQNYVLMLGTGNMNGLACYVLVEQDPLKNKVLFTI